jgi:hypothetical protein
VVDVRDGDEELVPEHQVRGELMGELVHRRRGELVARAQAPQEERQEHHRAVVVDGGVAHVHAHRVLAVLPLDGVEPPCGLLQGLLPGDGLPAGGGAPDGLAEPVRVLMEILERDGLGADVALAERILLIASDGGDATTSGLDAQSAHGLAEVAGAEVRLGGSRGGTHQGEYSTT